MSYAIKDWRRFQHYNKRNPPWIKLHQTLLDNEEWAALAPDASKLLVECWLLASRISADGEIGDAERIAWHLRRDPKKVVTILQVLVAQGFLVDASNVLAPCKQDASNVLAVDATPETEREAEREADGREGFDSFWRLHPKGPKAKALEEYRQAVPRKLSGDEITAHLREYTKTLTPKFTGHDLFRWIRDERWREYTDRQEDGPKAVPMKGGGFYVGG